MATHFAATRAVGATAAPATVHATCAAATSATTDPSIPAIADDPTTVQPNARTHVSCAIINATRNRFDGASMGATRSMAKDAATAKPATTGFATAAGPGTTAATTSAPTKATSTTTAAATTPATANVVAAAFEPICGTAAEVGASSAGHATTGALLDERASAAAAAWKARGGRRGGGRLGRPGKASQGQKTRGQASERTRGQKVPSTLFVSLCWKDLGHTRPAEPPDPFVSCPMTSTHTFVTNLRHGTTATCALFLEFCTDGCMSEAYTASQV